MALDNRPDQLPLTGDTLIDIRPLPIPGGERRPSLLDEIHAGGPAPEGTMYVALLGGEDPDREPTRQERAQARLDAAREAFNTHIAALREAGVPDSVIASLIGTRGEGGARSGGVAGRMGTISGLQITFAANGDIESVTMPNPPRPLPVGATVIDALRAGNPPGTALTNSGDSPSVRGEIGNANLTLVDLATALRNVRPPLTPDQQRAATTAFTAAVADLALMRDAGLELYALRTHGDTNGPTAYNAYCTETRRVCGTGIPAILQPPAPR